MQLNLTRHKFNSATCLVLTPEIRCVRTALPRLL